MLVSGIQQNDSAVYIYLYIYIYIYIFFFRFFSHIAYYRILSGVPCAILVPVDYLFCSFVKSQVSMCMGLFLFHCFICLSLCQCHAPLINKDLEQFFFFFLKLVFVVATLLNLFIYLFLAVLGLRFCARAFSSCGERGPLFIAVRRPLTVAASPVPEHRLQTRRLSSCGSRA